jgi:hypothetical protein
MLDQVYKNKNEMDIKDDVELLFTTTHMSRFEIETQ